MTSWRKLDDRPRAVRIRAWLLSWLSFNIQLRLGPAGFCLRCREFNPHTLVVQLFALILHYDLRLAQLGAVVEVWPHPAGRYRLRLFTPRPRTVYF